MTKELKRHTAMAGALLGVLMLTGGCASSGGAREDVTDAPDPITPEAALAAGDEAARRNEFERALAYYVRAVADKPSVEGWLRVGAASTRLGHSDRALQAYLQVIDLEPTHAEAREGAGLEYLTLDNKTAARDQLEEAVALDPRRWRSHNALGVIADDAQDHELAIRHYEAALELNPRSAMLLNNLGYSHYLSGDLDEAERDFHAATEIDQNYKPAWANLAMVYAQRGSYDEAVQTLSRASDRAAAYNDVGYIALQRNDLVHAEELLNEAVRLSPVYYAVAQRNLESVRAKLHGQP